MQNRYTIDQFRKDYPDSDTCLHKIFLLRYANLICPKCDGDKQFTRVKNKMSYQCPSCGYQVYPMAGTPFEKTRIPLANWFYAIYLQTTTRNGVAAKELERQLNICYETALRMSHQIKKLIAGKPLDKLNGPVEIDETYVGQKFATMNKKQREKNTDAEGNFIDNKTGVMGFLSREGRIRVEVMLDAKTFKERVKDNVHPEATLITDGHSGYYGLDIEYFKHEIINHLQGEYKRDEWHTNNIENFWSALKRTIKGTHIHVEARYLHLYANEVAFRYMHRKEQAMMFETILKNVVF